MGVEKGTDYNEDTKEEINMLKKDLQEAKDSLLSYEVST